MQSSHSPDNPLSLDALEDQLDQTEGLVEEEIYEPPILSDQTISQQVTRSCVEGEDCISVISRIEIEPGADRSIFHFPIHPPMKVAPQVDAFVLAGQDVRIRVTQKQRFGVRVELILGQPAPDPVESIIEFILRSEQKESACPSRPEAA